MGVVRLGTTACAGLNRLASLLLAPLRETVWVLYAGAILFLLPCVARSVRGGKIPFSPSLLCVTHVGNFDPLFVVRASRRYRMKAVFQVDTPRAFLRFLFRCIWRFRITEIPGLRETLNPKTVAEVLVYLRRGGSVMIYPEGYRPWERRLHPGVAVISHRSGVPIIPVGIENGLILKPEREHMPFLRAVAGMLRDYRKLKKITVHFGDPIYPDPALSEKADVLRLMRTVEAAFEGYYRRFYRRPGPIWEHTAQGEADRPHEKREVRDGYSREVEV